MTVEKQLKSKLAKGQHTFRGKPFDGEQNCEEKQNSISTLRIWIAGIDIFFQGIIKSRRNKQSQFRA